MTVHSYCEGASEPFLKRPFIWRSSCFASAWQAAQFALMRPFLCFHSQAETLRCSLIFFGNSVMRKGAQQLLPKNACHAYRLHSRTSTLSDRSDNPVQPV